MNKKLLTVAIGAALGAVTAVAQADVKVYGVAHVSVDHVDADTTPATEITNPWNVADNSSRFGIKVSEDLGGGFTGLAQFEIFVDNTEAAQAINTNRDNWVGVGHKAAGNLLLGRRDSAEKDVGGIADLFFREQLGEGRAITNYGGGDARNNESVTFESASFGPVSFKVQWFANDSQTNTNNGFNANVKADIVKIVTIGAAYWQTENAAEATTGYRAAVKGVIGPVTLTGLYQNVEGIGGTVGADRSAYGVGVAFKFLKSNTVKAQYYVADDLDSTAAEDGANMYAVGYDYAFSKNTVVYVAYAKTTNDDGGTTFGIGGNGHGEAYTTNIAGGEVSGFSLGTRVAF
jgi:predicted porin